MHAQLSGQHCMHNIMYITLSEPTLPIKGATMSTVVISTTFAPPSPHTPPVADVNPYAAHIYYNRGNLYKALSRYEEAEEDYRKGEYCSTP